MPSQMESFRLFPGLEDLLPKVLRMQVASAFWSTSPRIENLNFATRSLALRALSPSRQDRLLQHSRRRARRNQRLRLQRRRALSFRLSRSSEIKLTVSLATLSF